MNLELPFKNNRLFKALTGLSVEEFQKLVIDFDWNYKESRIKEKSDRIRKYGGGQLGKLPGIEKKLFFILVYLKIYPTFDVIGYMFGMVRSKSHRWQTLLLPILEQTLKRKLVLPERKVRSVKELFERFPDLKDIIIDGTERRVQRPRNKKKQNNVYFF